MLKSTRSSTLTQQYAYAHNFPISGQMPQYIIVVQISRSHPDLCSFYDSIRLISPFIEEKFARRPSFQMVMVLAAWQGICFFFFLIGKAGICIHTTSAKGIVQLEVKMDAHVQSTGSFAGLALPLAVRLLCSLCLLSLVYGGLLVAFTLLAS